jgi:uncharacterized membrane protein YiaA
MIMSAFVGRYQLLVFAAISYAMSGVFVVLTLVSGKEHGCMAVALSLLGTVCVFQYTEEKKNDNEE